MKSIDEVIRNIEGLYPTDSEYQDTNDKGIELLEQAKNNVGYKDNWRDLPEDVLREYERLCIREDNKFLTKKY